MSLFPDRTLMGDLRILEVYSQYDGIKFFSCVNEVGKTFLALWIDEEEDCDLWFYILISIKKLNLVRKGALDLHNVFQDPENKFIYKIRIPFVPNKKQTFEKIHSLDIDPNDLPLPDTFISIKGSDLAINDNQNILEIALNKGREIVYLVLETFSEQPSEIPVYNLGEILITYQPLINSVMRSKNPKSRKGFKSKEIQERIKYNTFVAESGSFKVGLVSAFLEEDNILDESLAGDAIEHIINLLKIGNNVRKLQQRMIDFPEKTAIKYRNFLDAIVKSGSNLTINWASPSLNRGGTVKISLVTAMEIIDVIKDIESQAPTEIPIIGRLFAIDINNWQFGIQEWGGKSDENYKGDILDEAKLDALNATVNQLYAVIIKRTIEISPIDGARKPLHGLKSLKPYTPNYEQMRLFGSSTGDSG